MNAKVMIAAQQRLQNPSMRKQAGLSLIESLLVLAVIALILIGAYQGYKIATGDVKATEMQKAAVGMAGGISRLYGTTQNYTGLTTTVLGNSGLVPPSIQVGGTAAARTLTNAWGGTVDAAPINSNGTANANGQFFALTFAGIEKEDCANFVSGIAGNAAAVYIVSGTGAFPATPAAANTAKAFQGNTDPGVIATQCGTGNVAQVRAVFR